jgi:hypothetical protein
MAQMNFNHIFEEIKRQREEFIEQSELIRLAEASRKSKLSETSGKYLFLAQVGKKLADFGANLEQRYSKQPQTQPTLNQQGNPEGCS